MSKKNEKFWFRLLFILGGLKRTKRQLSAGRKNAKNRIMPGKMYSGTGYGSLEIE